MKQLIIITLLLISLSTSAQKIKTIKQRHQEYAKKVKPRPVQDSITMVRKEQRRQHRMDSMALITPAQRMVEIKEQIRRDSIAEANKQ